MRCSIGRMQYRGPVLKLMPNKGSEEKQQVQRYLHVYNHA